MTLKKLKNKIITDNLFQTVIFYVAIAGFFCFTNLLHAQTPAIDSLRGVVEVAEDDSLRIEAMRALGVRLSDYDVVEAIKVVEEAIELSKAGGYELLQTDATNSLGIIYYGMGNYEKTLSCFYKVMAFHESRGDEVALSRIYNNMGLLLKELNRYSESIGFLERSVALKLKHNDLSTLSSSYNNLGAAYSEGLNDHSTAINYYRKALVLDRQHKDYYGIFISLGSIGHYHYKIGNLDSAQHYYNQAVMLIDKTDDRYMKAAFLYDFACLNSALGQYDRAIEKHSMSIEMAKEADARLILKKNYQGLSTIYDSLGDYKQALRYHKLYNKVDQQIFNDDQSRKIAEVESNYKIKSSQNEIELLKKESEIKDLRLNNSELLLYFLGGILAMGLFIVVMQYRKNVYKNRTNRILKQKNREIIEKNRNIMDSILYAKNIQEAILPENERLKSVFQDAFVLTKARDVVNGDFYWFAEEQNQVIIAAVDCTGHGVPAAFLNVMGNSLLNQIVNEEKMLEPAIILKELNQRIFKNLKYNHLQSKTYDGMDIGICLFDRTTKKLSFAGAKRPLYYFHNHELNIVKGDYYPVGGMMFDEKREYRQHELELKPKDTIYLFTDGIVDQFGGEANKKFMYPRFRGLLKSIAHQPMSEQLKMVEAEIRRWQGNNEQTDDILLIGVRI
ncbi:bacterial signal domain protein [Fulvivirga imtechensis AK7]|uniref:Bacterial signal domain protein n=1 Tax=Fulvivirga imtechensis AK7 TaxID=1237149 RepID=L8JVJ2_9BACT|nr:tetratricopeptide repeat protein [Fulvivirga imtechensis]ELR72805.1 bacterial signal domain protein [Fulvivirga imtechensis AK7]